MPQLYPEIEPYDHAMLEVGEGNLLYWESCGNPSGKPALVLHGGPGSGCGPRTLARAGPESWIPRALRGTSAASRLGRGQGLRAGLQPGRTLAGEACVMLGHALRRAASASRQYAACVAGVSPAIR